MRMTKEERFRVIWGELAAEGRADGTGGFQCQRAMQAWEQAGYPIPLLPWLERWLKDDDQSPRQRVPDCPHANPPELN